MTYHTKRELGSRSFSRATEALITQFRRIRISSYQHHHPYRTPHFNTHSCPIHCFPLFFFIFSCVLHKAEGMNHGLTLNFIVTISIIPFQSEKKKENVCVEMIKKQVKLKSGWWCCTQKTKSQRVSSKTHQKGSQCVGGYKIEAYTPSCVPPFCHLFPLSLFFPVFAMLHHSIFWSCGVASQKKELSHLHERERKFCS